MQRVKRFGLWQTAKVGGIIYFLMGCLFIPFFSLQMLFHDISSFPFEGGFFLAMPFIYGIMGFIFTALGCVIYNFVASWTGGIELEIETIGEDL